MCFNLLSAGIIFAQSATKILQRSLGLCGANVPVGPILYVIFLFLPVT